MEPIDLNNPDTLNNMDFDTKVEFLSALVENREKYQKYLGFLAASLPASEKGRAGTKELEKLANAVYEQTGIKIAVRTLYKYRQVCLILKPIYTQIPEDFSFNAWIHLSRQENPSMWLERAVKEGWSGPQLIREIHLINPPEKRIKICQRCGTQQPDPTSCLKCGEPL